VTTAARAVLIWLLALMSPSLAGAGAAAPLVLFDSAHHEQRFAHPPQRIASLLPSLTETVCALRECDRLVVVDRYSNWPTSVASLPKAGGLEDADVERIVRAHPDVVLLAHAAGLEARLRGLGLVVFELDTQTYADIWRNISTIGALLGVPGRAARLNRRIQRSLERIATATRRRLAGRAPLVYFEVDPTPYGAGPQSFIGQMLRLAGARNIIAPDLGPFPKLNPEYVVRANPDVIFVSPADAAQLARRPGWNRIRAVRERRICSFSPEVRDTIVRPGPRVAEGLEAMSACLLREAP
jgi:iron complex transport system substrate-binding protein